MRSSNTFSILFFVKKHRVSNGEVRITVDGKRLDLSVKRRVALDRWDESRGLAKGNRSDVKALNAYLEQVRNQLYDCQQQLERERKLITAESIKSRYLGQDERGKTLKEIQVILISVSTRGIISRSCDKVQALTQTGRLDLVRQHSVNDSVEPPRKLVGIISLAK